MGCLKSKSAKGNGEENPAEGKIVRLNTVTVETAPRGSVTIDTRETRSLGDVVYLDKAKSSATESRDKRLEEIKEKRRKEAEEDKRNAEMLFKVLGQ